MNQPTQSVATQRPIPLPNLDETLQKLEALRTRPAAKSRIGEIVELSTARSAVAAAVARAAAVAQWAEGQDTVIPTPFEFATLLAGLGSPGIARSRVGAIVARSTARRRVAAAVARAAESTTEFLQTPEGQQAASQFQLFATLAWLGTPRAARTGVGSVVSRSRARSAVAAAIVRALQQPEAPAPRVNRSPAKKKTKKPAKKPVNKKPAPKRTAKKKTTKRASSPRGTARGARRAAPPRRRKKAARR